MIGMVSETGRVVIVGVGISLNWESIGGYVWKAVAKG